MTTGTTVAARPVTDGKRIRWTLEERAKLDRQRVRVDWLRFTMPLDAVVEREGALDPSLSFLAGLDRHGRELVMISRGAETEATGTAAVCRAGARIMAEMLGFEVGQVEDKGMDFYAGRCALMHEGQTVGWVLAGAKSSAQAGTVHFNLTGSACLLVSHAKWQGVRTWLDEWQGSITRVDLAVDVWTGFDVATLPGAYLGGSFDVRGKRPKERLDGGWVRGESRTFYVGARDTGKLFRAYEKGDEMFPGEGDEWVRFEVELRDNARVITSAVLERPADFFAGAYPFCSELLDRLEVAAEAERIPAGQRLKDATVQAAAVGVFKWIARVAAPSVIKALELGGDVLDFIVQREGHRMPSRLRGFSAAELRLAFGQVAARFAPPVAPSLSGA